MREETSPWEYCSSMFQRGRGGPSPVDSSSKTRNVKSAFPSAGTARWANASDMSPTMAGPAKRMSTVRPAIRKRRRVVPASRSALAWRSASSLKKSSKRCPALAGSAGAGSGIRLTVLAWQMRPAFLVDIVHRIKQEHRLHVGELLEGGRHEGGAGGRRRQRRTGIPTGGAGGRPHQLLLAQLADEFGHFGSRPAGLDVEMSLHQPGNVGHVPARLNARPDDGAHLLQAVIGSVFEIDDHGFPVDRLGDDHRLVDLENRCLSIHVARLLLVCSGARGRGEARSRARPSISSGR